MDLIRGAGNTVGKLDGFGDDLMRDVVSAGLNGPAVVDWIWSVLGNWKTQRRDDVKQTDHCRLRHHGSP